MKIIDIAICVDNIDPKGMGRIRCVRYNDYVGEKENSTKYEKWSQNDPFIASPFLPNNINFVPENGQSVKLLNYNTDNENINLEYIAGPFTTMYDINSQNFSQQIENTTYGIAVKHKPDIRKSTGDYVEKKSDNTFAKETDYGIYGKFGSDILFTENGLQLRGGKLLSKDAASVKNRTLMISHPIMAKKSSRIYLKKFPKKGELTKRKKKTVKYESKDIKTIVEYEINNLVSPTSVVFYVYNVIKPYGQTFKTNFFTSSSPLIFPSLRLVNAENNYSTPTMILDVDSIDNVPSVIRDTLFTLHEKGLKEFNTLYSNEDLHPIYFRPTELFKTLTGTPEQNQKKVEILNSIKISSVGPSSGLIWSSLKITPKPIIKEIIDEFLKINPNSPEQTFSSVVSDKIYLLSTDPNETQKTVNFQNLDKYEYTQEDYLKNIDPNTYSTVRGENLVALLRSIINLLYSHQHNVVGPLLQEDPNYLILEGLLKNIEQDILNTSIKIN
jgi:hypothetical protein